MVNNTVSNSHITIHNIVSKFHMTIHIIVSNSHVMVHNIYTTIGELSSKFDEFLAVRSQFDSDHGVDFLRLHVANPRPLCDRFLRFIVLCFFTKNNNK